MLIPKFCNFIRQFSGRLTFRMDEGSRRTEATGKERGGEGVQILKIPPTQSSPVVVRFDFGRMCDRSFLACDFFFFFKVEISSLTLIPPFRLGSVHSGSAS